MKPHKTLEQWLQAQINDKEGCRRFHVGRFLEKLGVTSRALWTWRHGTFTPSHEHRATLERLTDGAVPASIWER